MTHVAVEERLHPYETVLGRGMVVLQGVAFDDLAAVQPHVVEGMDHPWIGVHFKRLVGFQSFAERVAAQRRSAPIVIFAGKCQERHRAMRVGIAAWSVIIDRGLQQVRVELLATTARQPAYLRPGPPP